ncbi:MAG: SIS domain-containing protein [Actinobacteria bacterium]|nr:MAG: SIS domain-containing protein [Actinomycetota bacterium]
MSAIASEIASQPSCWRKAGEVLAAVGADLPVKGERVAVAGCGTSLYVARAYAALRESSGHGETDAFPASEFPAARPYDRVLAISRSGTTTEVVRLLEGLEPRPRVIITADAGSPAASAADARVVLDFADERSVVQTRFATSVLAMFRAQLGEDLAAAIGDAERALDEPLPASPEDIDHVVFLGHGWTVGVAEEAALKLREASRTYSEAYPAMEYRHGPISLAGERSLVWILSTPDEALTDDVRATGAMVRVASLDPMAELVMAQRLAVAIAGAKGIDPDHPRYLTRSVVLS